MPMLHLLITLMSSTIKGQARFFGNLSSSITHSHPTSPYVKLILFSTTTTSSSSSSRSRVAQEVAGPSKDAAQVLREWGCSETDLANIFRRQPSLCRALATRIESKLKPLSQLGLNSSDLVKMINCRPRFLSCCRNHCFDQRVVELQSLFGSKEVFLKAVVRNPSLLLYDFHKTVKPVVSLYEQMGVTRQDLISMLLVRPTLIPRTHMNQEKLEYIRRTGVTKDSKMYKYVVTIIGVSRLDTIREKLANLAKFGLSEDKVLKLFGQSPLLMTLSVDKVERNMKFVMGVMKLPGQLIVCYPFLVYASLEDTLKPRMSLAEKIQAMGLCPQIKGPKMMTALRMTEKRFLDVFVMCHEKDVREELLDYYLTAKGMKRLAESASRTTITKGFPF